MNNSTLMSFYDPYVYEALSSLIRSNVTVQTTQGSVQGRLDKVLPDHIVVVSKQTPFYVRTSQIVWVFPS